MNKKIITIIAIFFSILFIDSVKAWGNSDYINVNYNGSLVQEKMSEYSEFVNFMDNNIIAKLNNDSYDYLINLNFDIDKLNYCVTQKKNSSDNFQIRSLFEYNTASGLQIKPNDLNKRYYCYSSVEFNNNTYTTDNIYSFLESSSFSTGSSMWNYASIYYYVANRTNNIDDDIYNDTNDSRYSTNIIYYSNTDILITKYDDSTFLPITFNGDNKSYVGDKFYTYLDMMDKTPTILFSVSENKETINGEEIVTSKDLTVNFSIIDNENYRYLISFDRENWSSITIDEGNSMTFNIKENKTVYVQVLNASDYSMVTSATYLIDGIEEPSLKLKSTFTSELYPGLSKVSVEFNEDIVYKGKINFKLQYGSYEINKNYIPTIKSYKIYAKDLYSDSHWTEISEDSNIYISDIKKNTDFNSSIAESIYTFSLNIPDDICIYQTYRIEIHFENTNNNYYIYTFDNLSSSKWLAYEDIFDNYIYYEFPKDKEYALISHKNIVENKSMIYVPYNDIINEKSLFRAYIYDYKSKITTTKLQYNLVESNNYYAYYNFDFSFDRNEMLMLQRKKDTDETVGFYVPNGYIVQFLDDLNDSMSIKTPNGFVDINSGDIDNVFDESATATDYLRIAKKFLNNISDYIKSFFEIIVYFFNKLPAEMYTAIITIFIVFVMCAIIYNIKK